MNKIKEKLKKIFNLKSSSTDFGDPTGCSGTLYLCKENEFEKEQVGYRIDNERNLIKNWIGENYFIIGYLDLLGDPILVDINDKYLPIYFMFHDDWKYFEKIANSIEDFEKILEIINSANLKSENELIKTKEKIAKLINCDFWNTQLDFAFYND